MLVLAKPKLATYLLVSDFPSKNPRAQNRTTFNAPKSQYI